ncbi:hypothetical protein FGADI_9123 [Fusarium gaditjirri]|uniref:Uncharacterized protein n=1 Tax=Fusarium gaditjirri TaxID=282569 RepID=A0A8H4T0L3_9HYPO|nr:hypothetical protein FGADI_9123 [Fusarium gaditjirri]
MAPSSAEAKPDKAARDAEYQALWQVCDRASRKHEYIYADDRLKRSLLEDACDAIMLKRQKLGKDPCGTDIDAMVNLHLQREVTGRLLATARMGAPIPSPNPMPYMNNGPAFNAPQNAYPVNPGPFNGNPAAYNVPHPPLNAAPQPQARVLPPDFDFSAPNSTEELREDMATVINTLRDFARRIAVLEQKVGKLTQERDRLKAGAFDMMNAGMNKSASVPPAMFHYPHEGIEGLSAVAYSHPGPLTPRSQTQEGDEGGDGTYQPGN